MTVNIVPGKLSGSISAIPSKSDAHRLLICAALADKPTVINMRSTSEDIEATARCLRAMGAGIEYNNGKVFVTPVNGKSCAANFDCGESGSTLRFLIPVAAAVCEKSEFSGSGRLPERPIGELVEVLRAHGAKFSADTLPFTLEGGLKPGEFMIAGNISSQYVTGLLLALPNLKGDSEITITAKLESAAYVDITLFALSRFGITVKKTENGYFIPAPQRFISPGNITVDGDWSNAAFFMAAGALGDSVTVSGLDERSVQGDKKITDILRFFGAGVSISESGVKVSPGELTARNFDISEIPDMLPILSVLAAFSKGDTVFSGGGRLRFKESDRLVSCCDMINSLGGRAEETEDGIIVYGTGLRGGVVQSHKDHRIAMAAAAASVGCCGKVTIIGAEAVNKSYPGFWKDFNRLGGRADVI